MIANHEEDVLIREDVSELLQHHFAHLKLTCKGSLPGIFLICADAIEIHEVTSQEDGINLLHDSNLDSSSQSFQAVIWNMHIRQPQDLLAVPWEDVRQVFSFITGREVKRIEELL